MLHKCNHAFNCVDKTSVNVIKPEKQLMSAGDKLYIRINGCFSVQSLYQTCQISILACCKRPLDKEQGCWQSFKSRHNIYLLLNDIQSACLVKLYSHGL